MVTEQETTFFEDCKAEVIATSSERNTASQHIRLGEAGCTRVDSEQEDINIGGELVDGRAGGWILPFVKTTIEIKGGDDLRFSYGAEYWKSRADNVKWLRHEMKRAHVQVKKEMEREETWQLRNNLMKQREDELITKEHALDSIVAQRRQFP
ncbi:hypothetical protein CEUSTIGMA_g6221.t1 [Chlamydomonas eustigma]|uniref:SET domain-containing protein n=1 Tax=Chlamydomonas eustigma TaxID=1157962 RepID=A0A250X6R2_9CHLO|nr:hypothetical protein CEUSTIGMA_g6221.t1 [Chlamydomonas eustigma]|eukprot:GAX78784.1 hypothetical protein CEUSTIGMA_g6221.t1 [Chlamydomonas eustigma]